VIKSIDSAEIRDYVVYISPTSGRYYQGVVISKNENIIGIIWTSLENSPQEIVYPLNEPMVQKFRFMNNDIDLLAEKIRGTKNC
jgi:hypothetical protein